MVQIPSTCNVSSGSPFTHASTRTFEVATLQPLLQWADASLETSVNQPTLPHAIIALNKCEPSADPSEWDSNSATNSLLAANRHCIDRRRGHPFFIGLAESWRERGRRIDSILDLIYCYYSTFQVIRIPREGRYQLLHNQVNRFYQVINSSREMSFGSRKRANMLFKSLELDMHFQAVFSHFSRTLTMPFDFIAMALINNPIPNDFGGHMLQLALAIQAHNKRSALSKSAVKRIHKATSIFDRMSRLVASSISLDCVRNRKETFWSQHLTCEFSNGSYRCVNVGVNHDPKGHQNAKGKVIPGDFESSFQPESYLPVWEDSIRSQMLDIDRELGNASRRAPGYSREAYMMEIHHDTTIRFFNTLGSASGILSHATCFCCLMQSPEHALRCGHVLCTQCVRAHGQRSQNATNTRCLVNLGCCPLHPEETQWEVPCLLRFKPEHAGVRLLCLDGGGVRGIVELEVLRAIQNQIGDRIPIQAFFDLIMGTSTGGIIALAMVAKSWSLRRCSDKFRSLCNTAFTPRALHSIPFLKHLITLRLTSKYSTGPFRETLKQNFGEEHLFGNYGERTYVNTKVAVTATDKTGSKAIIIANYSRKEDENSSLRPAEYEFLRPDRSEIGLSTADAAAATSAAPTFFKPFEHADTHRTYLDGAIYLNNPVRLMNHERKLIWPDVADRAPDLFLSIGTSQNRADLRADQLDVTVTDEERARRPTFYMMPQIVTQMVKTSGSTLLTDQQPNLMDNILVAEQAWDKFCSDIAPARDDALRYVRVNPDIERQPPRLDEVKRIGELIRDTRRALKTPASRAQIARVTHILVASDHHKRSKEVAADLAMKVIFTVDSRTTLPCSQAWVISSQSARQVLSSLTSRFSLIWIVLSLKAKRKDSQIDISLHIRSRDLAPAKYHISGFPRAVMRDDEPKSGQ
ncbi:hypothetical protein IG631_10956 [Alternaria alternata]|nr:hypothetical protein IG631_10956 [Alternaria alternata]